MGEIDGELEKYTRFYKMKWVGGFLVWGIILVVFLAGLVSSELIVLITFLVAAYYFGAWSSEYLIGKIAEIYYRAIEEGDEQAKQYLTFLMRRMRRDE